MSGPGKEMLLLEGAPHGPRGSPAEEGVPDPKGNTTKKHLHKAPSWNFRVLHPQRGPTAQADCEVLQTEFLLGVSQP